MDSEDSCSSRDLEQGNRMYDRPDDLRNVQMLSMVGCLVSSWEVVRKRRYSAEVLKRISMDRNNCFEEMEVNKKGLCGNDIG